MRKATIFIVVTLLLTLFGMPVNAADMPPLPHAFYGTVEINGSPAPVGTNVEARGEGVETATHNPITTTERGKYGNADPLGAKLIVQGDISGGATITFYVNGTSTGQSYPFDSGETTPLDLSVTIVAPSSRPPRPAYVETTLFGMEESFSISDEGEVLETIVATSEDEDVTITIEEGTIALDEEGEPLETLTAAVEPSPPEPPEGTYLMGAYDFGPDGATFDPPLTLTWSYDPEAVPEGMDLVIAYYDEVAGEWVYLPCEVDTENNIITASVEGFTTFAIIAIPAPVPPVAPPEEVVAPPEEVVAPPEEVAPPAKPPINWPVVGGVIGGVVVVGLLIFFLVRRRAY